MSRSDAYYKLQCKLIAEKFNNEIEPKPVTIFRRKNARFIGMNKSQEIMLHNKRGTNRETLIHELVHVYFHKRYPSLRKHHNREFFELVHYLCNGGTVKDFYSRDEKKKQRIKEIKTLKKSPEYQLEHNKSLLKKWLSKKKRAETVIKKLQKKIKRCEVKLNEQERTKQNQN